jgi:hypothetical protein
MICIPSDGLPVDFFFWKMVAPKRESAILARESASRERVLKDWKSCVFPFIFFAAFKPLWRQTAAKQSGRMNFHFLGIFNKDARPCNACARVFEVCVCVCARAPARADDDKP